MVEAQEKEEVVLFKNEFIDGLSNLTIGEIARIMSDIDGDDSQSIPERFQEYRQLNNN